MRQTLAVILAAAFISAHALWPADRKANPAKPLPASVVPHVGKTGVCGSLYEGSVQNYDADKGQGVIRDAANGKEYPVNKADLMEPVYAGDKVCFQLNVGQNGARAEQVRRPVRPKIPPPPT